MARFAVSHASVDVRREAIETLTEHAPSATVIDVLARIVNTDSGEDTRDAALEGLAELSDGAGVPTLIDIARSHPSADVRREALKRLVESDDPRAKAVFARALSPPR